MDSARNEAFETASRCLERLAQLKEKRLLEDPEYQELRNLLMLQMKRCAGSGETIISQEEKTAERVQGLSVSYGQLHSDIVQKIESMYKSARDNPKQRVFRTMAEMAERQALYPGDSEVLTELVEAVFSPLEGTLDDTTGEASRKLVQIQRTLIEISAKIRDARGASPAARAIADISLQSTARAAAEFSIERTKLPAADRMTLPSLWGKYVLKDVEGGFEGGAATVAIASAFAAPLPIALPIVAAFGVLVGAGIRSALAYAERDKQN